MWFYYSDHVLAYLPKFDIFGPAKQREGLIVLGENFYVKKIEDNAFHVAKWNKVTKIKEGSYG